VQRRTADGSRPTSRSPTVPLARSPFAWFADIMKTRALITLLCAGAAGLVWSPRAHSEASYPLLQTLGRAPRDTLNKATNPAPSKGRRKMDGKLVSSLNVARVGNEVRFTFNVANAGTRRVEVKFPNGQTHDIVVLDSTGREVWRWADGRMFTEARQYRALGGGDSLVLEEGWDRPFGTGKLVAIARLKSTNFPIEHTVEFTLP
jgi:hypothetical protein